MMGDYSMDEIKCIVRSIAISGSSYGLTVKDLIRDFKNIEGFDLPFQRLGFRSAEQLLHTLTDTVTVNGSGPTAVVEPIVSQSNKHIRQFVKLSKKTKSYKKPNNYSNNRTYSNNNYGKPSGYNPSYNRPYNSNYDSRNSEPRKVVNSEFDYHDATVTNRNDSSDSSDSMPKFTMGTGNKLVQVMPSENSEKKSNAMSKEALPDRLVVDFVNSLEVPVKAMHLGDEVQPAIISEAIVPKGTVRMFVTEVHNPNRFWYHLGDSANKIDEMMNEIETFYSHLEREEWRLKPANIIVGFYCVAKYNSQWHRARIVGEYSHNKAKVFYIDYGTVAELELKDLKYMAKCFADMPAQAMRASMAYVKPVNHRWTRDASWSLLSLVFDKVLYAYVVDVDRVDNVLHVVLIDTTGAQDSIINQQLFVKGHAIWEDDLPFKQKSTEAFRERIKSYCEIFPRFQEIESGFYPTLADIGTYYKQGFNFDRYYSQSMHNGLEYLGLVESRIYTTEPVLLLSKAAVKMHTEPVQSENDSYHETIQQNDEIDLPVGDETESTELHIKCDMPSTAQEANGLNYEYEQLSLLDMSTEMETQENASSDDDELKLIIPKSNTKRKQVRFVEPLISPKDESQESSVLTAESQGNHHNDYVKLEECTDQCD